MSFIADQKSISRADLQSDTSRSPTPDDFATDAFRALLNRQFGSLEDVENDSPVTPSQKPEPNNEEEEETGFRLFASQDAVTTIDLGVAEAQDGEGGFVVKERDQKYYFTDDLSPEEWTRLHEVAVDGADVLAQARSRWAGSALAWKVTVADWGPPQETPNAQRNQRKRGQRPGKKSRIAARKELRKKQEEEERAKAAAVEKEAYMREKKTAENRKKQLKKRAKEKAKKEAAGGSIPEGDVIMGEASAG